MKFSLINAALFALAAGTAVHGLVVQERSEAVAARAENAAAGFGCPTDKYQCDSHCKGLGGGRTGEYCGGFLWGTCYCVFG